MTIHHLSHTDLDGYGAQVITNHYFKNVKFYNSNYGKRWGIEVFFKVCKSFLRLEKDCRSLSYDAMTAHVSIVFTRYMFLAVEQRECKDARSLGELFYLSVDELPDVCFVEAMRLLLLLFVERLQEKPMLDEGEIQGQLQGFLKELPVLLSQKLRKCA